MFIQLMIGARRSVDEVTEYEAVKPVYVNPDLICGYYDHTILIQGQKIHVMETSREICRLMEEYGKTVYQKRKNL